MITGKLHLIFGIVIYAYLFAIVNIVINDYGQRWDQRQSPSTTIVTIENHKPPKHVVIEIYGGIDDATYDTVSKAFEGLTKNDKVTMIISSPGGYVNAGTKIVYTMLASEAYIVAEVPNSVASMAAIIPFFADEIRAHNHSKFLFHAARVPGEVLVPSNTSFDMNYHAWSGLRFLDEMIEFLTLEDWRNILKGKDVVLTWEEIKNRVASKACVMDQWDDIKKCLSKEDMKKWFPEN